MSKNDSIFEIARSLVEDPEYVKALTRRIKTRTADQEIVQRLIAYARDRQATAPGHGAEGPDRAGVSWESL